MAGYDYTQPGSYPRSGREMLGGIVFLPRTIDKMRAYINGTVGDYNVGQTHRGLSDHTYALFGVTVAQFEQAVRENPTDEGVLEWLYRHGKRPTPQEIEAYNRMVLALGPQTEPGLAAVRARLAKLGFADRTDVTAFLDLHDLEEGREVPRRG